MRDDTISRQAAIEAFRKSLCALETESGREYGISFSGVERILKSLPSDQPERKRGKWIYNSPVTMKCNQCGLVIKDWDWHRFKYCPNCDADMREVDDGRPE